MVVFDDVAQVAEPGRTTYAEKQLGQINGLVFARANIKVRTFDGAEVEGCTYVSRDGPHVIVLRIYDAHFGETEKLGTAAIQTFRKKP